MNQIYWLICQAFDLYFQVKQLPLTIYYFLLMYSTFLNSNLSYIIIIIERVWITKAHIDWLMRSWKMNSKCIFDCTMRHFSSDIYKILEVLMVLSSQNNVRNVSNFPPIKWYMLWSDTTLPFCQTTKCSCRLKILRN